MSVRKCASGRQHARTLRVLIVEDNEEVAEMLVVFFGSRGLKVTMAGDGDTALRQIRDALPNLILLDVGLPDIDGYELFKRFRQSVRTRYIPVIFLTRRSRKTDRIAGLELGADDFITKPFDLEELFLRVQNAVDRAERENLTNPHTGLPAGQLAREAVAAAAKAANRWCCSSACGILANSATCTARWPALTCCATPPC